MAQHLTGTVKTCQIGQRFDLAVAELFPNYSRSRIKNWIMDGKIIVNGLVKVVPKEKMRGGETIAIPAVIDEIPRWKAQDLALNIVYEDADLIVINKPRDLVVHPGAGHADGTVLNALLHYYPQIANVPRAGIVHRLDKDTTGLMIVAKTVLAQNKLVESLHAKMITREYEAIAIGTMIAGGKIEQPIARHATKRTKMVVVRPPMGKLAVTNYRIMEHFSAHTRLRLRLDTGRTHQIRVHMAFINHPIVGDKLYGGHQYLPKGATDACHKVLRNFDRQALHATILRLYHPITSMEMKLHAPIPQDMMALVKALKEDYELRSKPESGRR